MNKIVKLSIIMLTIFPLITGCGCSKKEEKKEVNQTTNEPQEVIEDQVFDGLEFVTIGLDNGIITTIVINNTGVVYNGSKITMKVMDSKGNVLGNFVAVLSGVCYAGVFMMNSFEKSDAISSVFIGHGLSAVIGCPLVFGETDFGIQAISGILILGIFQMAIAYIFMTKGLEQVSAVTASLTTAIEPILNPLLVAFFWGEMVTPLSLVGAIIVVVSIVGYNLIKKDSL